VIVTVLRFVYVLCDLLAIGVGTNVLFWLLCGDVADKSIVHLVRYIFAMGVMGLLFPTHHLPSPHRIFVLFMCMSGALVLAWPKVHLGGLWYSIFALCTNTTLRLSVDVALAQAAKCLSPLTMLAPAQCKSILAFAHDIAIASCAEVGILAVRERASIDRRRAYR
jgi:hypothetical protein